MKKALILIIALTWSTFYTNAQNTVGLLSHDQSKTMDGYSLMFPHNQSNVYLLNNCGQIAKVWKDSVYTPGNSTYLMPNGKLYKAISRGAQSNAYINAGGGGEGFERRNWNDDIEWRWFYNDSTHRPHHDFVVMENGHLLAIVWDRISGDSAIALGRDPSWMKDGEVWGEKIIEINPIGTDSAEIVWEWNAFQHLTQHFDSTKRNYRKTTYQPNLIDINFGSNANDWLHINSIDFHPQKNQIMLSVPTFNEIWIIDHTTTTALASGHSGGFGGRGGDLLFRWGNSIAYDAGVVGDQKLFFEHHVHWMDLELSSNDPDFGKIMIFNNRAESNYSTVNIIDPIFDSYEWEYGMNNNAYLPVDFDWTYRRPDSAAMYSTGLSSVQRLPNGNTFICVGRDGYAFEMTADEEIVWEYKNPMSGGNAVAQGTKLNVAQNQMFRMTKYPANYAAFTGKNLKSKGYIERNPDTTFCSLVTDGITNLEKDFAKVYPNPTTGRLLLTGDWKSKSNVNVVIQDLTGRTMQTDFTLNENGDMLFNISYLPAGLYVISVSDGRSIHQSKVLKQ